jgi:hypothetical protein
LQAAHNKVPVPNTYKAFHMAKLASATKVKPYDPATPESSYTTSTARRKQKYDDGFKRTLGEDADPSSQDLIPELVMVTGEGKKHGRPSLGASSFPIETESLASIRARSTSSSLQIQRRDEPARELRAVSFFKLTLFSFYLHVFVLTKGKPFHRIRSSKRTGRRPSR